MATYKVPQDVEADDKLIGPFSFRQFIYLIIVALSGVAAWGLSQLFIGLVIIPLPIILFFGALALPLRKDQPMEIYMAAMVSFYLKPRMRKWDPEGIESLIEISAPKTVEVRRTKDLSQTEASQRLSYLADIVDSGGWAIRGVNGMPSTVMNNDVYLEAQSATDILDTNTSVAHTFDQMMSASTERMREEARERMLQATQVQAPATSAAIDPNAPAPHFDPYPNFRQSIIQPLNDTTHRAESDIAAPAIQQTPQPVVAAAPTPAQQPLQQPPLAPPVTQSTPQLVPNGPPADSPIAQALAQAQAAAKPTHPAAPTTKVDESTPSTSDTALTAGIMNLANNPDLSIETIAHEAKRLHEKAEESSDEVIISLR